MRVLNRWFDLWIPRAVRTAARIDILAAVLYGLFGGLTAPFVPVMGRLLGASSLQVSVLVAAPAMALLLSLWWVNLIRTVHPVRLVAWPATLGRALFFLMPLIHRPAVYVAVVVTYHAIASIGMLGYAQVMRAVYPDEARGRIMAVVRIGMAGAWIAGSLVGGQIMQEVAFQWVFGAAAAFGVASGLVFRRIQISAITAETQRVSPSHTMQVMKDDRPFRRLLAAFFVFGFGGWLSGPAVPITLVDVLHATPFQVGLLGAVTSGMWLIAYSYWGRMIDRRGATGTLKIVFLIGVITPLIYILAPNAWIVLLAGVTEGFVSSGVDLGWLAAVLQYSPPGKVRHYVAIFNTLVGIRGSTAPFLAALLLPAVGVRWVFAFAAAFILIGGQVIRAAAPPAESSTP